MWPILPVIMVAGALGLYTVGTELYEWLDNRQASPPRVEAYDPAQYARENAPKIAPGRYANQTNWDGVGYQARPTPFEIGQRERDQRSQELSATFYRELRAAETCRLQKDFACAEERIRVAGGLTGSYTEIEMLNGARTRISSDKTELAKSASSGNGRFTPPPATYVAGQYAQQSPASQAVQQRQSAPATASPSPTVAHQDFMRPSSARPQPGQFTTSKDNQSHPEPSRGFLQLPSSDCKITARGTVCPNRK